MGEKMTHTAAGLNVIGTNAISTSLSKATLIDKKWREVGDEETEVFAAKITQWENTTIGDIINRSITRKSKNDKRVTDWKLLSAQELAFYVLNRTSAEMDTPCRLGYGARNRAIRVGNIEYRSRGYRLHERNITPTNNFGE